MKLFTKVVSLSVVGALCLTAFGETLSEQKEEKDNEARLVAQLDTSNKDCGGLAITGGIDWPSFKFDDKHGRNAAGQSCIVAAAQISYMCRRFKDDGKAKVKAKIKKLACSYSETEGTTVKDGVMDVRYNFKNVNIGDNVAKALGDQL
jgi:hypothetical protein